MRRFITVAVALLLGWVGSTPADILDGPDHTFLSNRFNSFEVGAEYAVATTDDGIVVLQIDSLTEKFTTVGQLSLGLPACDATLADSIVIVSSCAGPISLVNLSALPELSLIGTVEIDCAVHDVAMWGTDLYVACGFDGLRRYSLADPLNPAFLDSSLVGVHCIQLEIADDHLFLLDDYNGILRYDLDISGLQTVSSILWLPRRAMSFDFIDDTLTVALVDRSLVYRGIVGAAGSSLTDSLELLITPDVLFQHEDMFVAINWKSRLLERIVLPTRQSMIIPLDMSYLPVPSGDTYSFDGIPHLALLSDRYGLVSYRLDNLWVDDNPRSAYTHPGPITALTFYQQKLVTGGEGNPIEFYDIDPGGQPALDTTYYGLGGVGNFVDGGSVLFASLPETRQLAALRLYPGGIELESVTSTWSDQYRQLRYYPDTPIDSQGVLLAVSQYGIEFYSVSDSWHTSRVNYASPLDGALDAILVDSFLVVSTTSRQLYIYRMFSDLRPILWWTVSTPVNITHFAPTGSRYAHEGWIYPEVILGFGGRDMYELTLQDDGFPSIYFMRTLPVEVTATDVGDNIMFTTGSEGLGRIDLGLYQPEMVEFGGYGGHLIAYEDSVLAASDGSAVFLYSIGGGGGVPAWDEPASELTVATGLGQNYPNPFNPKTQIDFRIDQPGEVELAIFDLLGRRVTTLVDDFLGVGDHSAEWSGLNDRGQPVASGVYFYRMTSSAAVESRKMILLK